MRPPVMVAPNGARRGKADHPALPVTLAETVETARACHASGAEALHLHIRDEAGAHSLDSGRYREALAELARQIPGMAVQITTEAVGIYDVAAQLRCLTEVQPGWASVAVRETARDLALAPRLYATCAAQGTRVQHILYDTDDIALLRDWQARGIVRPGQDGVLFVLGRYSAGQVSSPDDLTPFRTALPEAGDWMVCAFGPDEHACLAAAAAQGAALRVGFENSLTGADGQPHPDNAASVAALRQRLERTRA
ncbi:3-keto-5-aminohexanoate cleavage protein [Pararhodobacter aggregans]|uniref:3-keto-5-aminohexanoate cleavage protein n=1 Tax=Pararhodobacter aggregans TaxID=404875 RepID=A0A2T7USM9_9RHOB|nr:3-keto-5-aminohexanoate cleavage protein [Pararhodobacter aggregans]PTX03481.1 uncharacterized protein (DUF849 family) [Pararhodobacter aggregans]PVE47770.1 3-keto-5-aminohexanoate cleavage protein [Pararhodobacter aggregans]